MRKFLVMLLCVVLLGSAVATLPGCGGKKRPPADVGDEGEEGGEGAGAGKARALLNSSGWATIKGTVTYDGTPPEPKPIADMASHNDKHVCLKGDESEHVEQRWFVNKKNGGVEHVVVYVNPPEGKYFKIKDEDKDQSKAPPKILGQPHCAFVPHVIALFPSYYDGEGLDPELGREKMKSTKQVFKVTNEAPVTHNAALSGASALVGNANFNLNMPPGKEEAVSFNPQPDSMVVSCKVHNWMNARIFVFDNPYHAVTDKDGKFEIKNVPAGAQVHVVAWCEGVRGNWSLPQLNGTREGEPMTLKDGDVKELNFKVKQ